MTAPKLVLLGSCIRSVPTWNPARANADEEFIYIDLSAVDQEFKKISGTKQLRCEDAPSRARQLIESGDILVSTVRPNLNGVAYVDANFHGATASTGFCVLRPKPEILDSRFVFHWVQSPAFIDDMIRKATGASYPAVSDRIIFESAIPLPDIEEQRRIAAILDQADALRAKRREALAELDGLAQAIFVEMFGDTETNSLNWPESLSLGDIADIASGVTKGRKLNGAATKSVPYLAVSNVQDKALNLSAVKEIEATDAEITRYRLKTNDLLLTEGGDPDKLGRGTLWNDEIPECIHQNHIFRVRLTSNAMLPIFLNWLVGSARGKKYFLRSAKQTTGIASINMTQLRGFPLICPSIELQAIFAARIQALESLKATHRTALTELDALFASLQHRAFRGEL